MNRFKKKQLSLINAYSEKTGIRIAEMGECAQPKKDRLINCLVKGFLIFLAVYSLNMFFVTSFDLPCSRLIVAFAALILSMFAAMFYYNKLCFNLGFITLFLLFLPLSLGLVSFANSGMNAIINVLLAEVDKKLNLDGVRVYQEIYTNRYLTVTCCLILMMFMEICFLNAFISEHLSGILTFAFAYPFYQICIYLCDTINYTYVFLYLFVVVACIILKHGNRFRPVLMKRFQGCTIRKGKVIYNPVVKQESGLIIKTSALVFPFFLALFILGVMLLRFFPYSARNNVSDWKKTTDEAVAQFALHGVAGYFNSYDGAGGMYHGRLGGVREVYQDFQTDLIVRYVPFSSDTLYLKSFVGTTYYKNQWKNASLFSKDADQADYDTVEAAYLKKRYEDGEDDSAMAFLEVQVVDYMMVNETFTPSYNGNSFFGNKMDYQKKKPENQIVKTMIDRSEWPPSNRFSRSVYYPVLNEDLVLNAQQYDEQHEEARSKAYSDEYLQVPDDVQTILGKIIEEEDFHGNTMEIISQIQKYFYDNFVYSLAPGKTPNNRDFVTYFLTRQKKGYCTHFATVGALLLRQMGIPACYVEGYAIDLDTAADSSDILSYDPKEWYDGDNLLADEEDVPVLEVEVSDAHAHAWVMVYLDGFGWYPVEFTTVRLEEKSTKDDFWSNLGRYFTGDEGESPLIMLTEQARKIGSGLLNLLLRALIIAALAVLIIVGIRKWKLYFVPSNKRLSNQYVLLNRLLNRYYLAKPKNVYHLDSVAIGKELGMEENGLSEYAALTERASYGKDRLSAEELNKATKLFRMYIRTLRSHVKGLRKVFLMLRV
ncbi:MAG: transglutaminase domain-containing protein [Lachnospiraceae bacterium]|nr:transglutaminase domain-containing protein [Lachnospiraceae bacterium]